MVEVTNRGTALVTGIRGFTGEYVASELRRNGYQVFGTCLREDDADEFVSVIDLRDRNSVLGYINKLKPKIVIHLAAISFVGHEDIQEIYEMNIVGTRNLLEGLAKLDVVPDSIVLASSANIYGNSPDDPISETSPVLPQNDYAVSKFAMELMARTWLERLPITIVRPFNYIGRGQSTNFLIPKIVEAVKAGDEEISLGNIDVERDFSDVRTVAWVYGQLAMRPSSGEVFNISSGHSIPLTEAFDRICSIGDSQMRIKPTEHLKRSGEVSRLRGDSSKLWKHLGKPIEIPLDETFAWMLERY